MWLLVKKYYIIIIITTRMKACIYLGANIDLNLQYANISRVHNNNSLLFNTYILFII